MVLHLSVTVCTYPKVEISKSRRYGINQAEILIEVQSGPDNSIGIRNNLTTERPL
jgi:hypothetical protein